MFHLSPSSSTPLEFLDVLEFWFGDDEQILYKTKWFADSENQIKIDQEITKKYEELLENVLNGKYSSYYNYLFNENIQNEEKSYDNFYSILAIIIILDQFSRHIYRYKKLASDDNKRKETDSLALKISLHFIQLYKDEIQKYFSVAKFVFTLMPLRHSSNLDNYRYIMNLIDEKESAIEKSNELLKKFYKQSLRRLQHFEDRARVTETEGILERPAIQTDETNIMNHPLVKTTEAFLKKNLKTAYSSGTNASKQKTILVISLSGGVDSMVLSKILSLLHSHKRLPIDNVLAIHIDYANRPESGEEAAYVVQWARSLNILPRVRVVNEATRGVTDRDEYEKVTRQIRYGFYQTNIEAALNGEYHDQKCFESNDYLDVEAINKLNSQEKRESDDLIYVSGVMFGHHIGDVQENVISNVMRGTSPLDLSGMTECSIANNVHIWRPLLPHTKDEIYDFAHTYGVPYFKDTTPSWSTRGKLRNKLIPLLLEIYGDGCLRNLSSLAEESDQLHDLVYKNLYDPFMQSILHYPTGLTVKILPFRLQPTCFWRESLKLIMHSMGMGMIRDKAVGNFVERIHKPLLSNGNIASGWLELRKGYHTFMTDEGELQVLRDGVLRKNVVTVNPATTRNQLLQKQKKNDKNITVESDQVNQVDSKLVKSNCFICSLNSENDVEYNAVDLFQVSSRDFSHMSTSMMSELMNYQLNLSEEKYIKKIGKSFSIGPWIISFDILNEVTGDKRMLLENIIKENSSNINTNKKNDKKLSKIKFLQQLNEIYANIISYKCLVPISSSNQFNFLLLNDLVQLYEKHLPLEVGKLFYEEESKIQNILDTLSIDLRSADFRLRDGLPLFVPYPSNEHLENETDKFKIIQVNIKYEGPNDFH